jgi:hypothetical protein
MNDSFQSRLSPHPTKSKTDIRIVTGREQRLLSLMGHATNSCSRPDCSHWSTADPSGPNDHHRKALPTLPMGDRVARADLVRQ